MFILQQAEIQLPHSAAPHDIQLGLAAMFNVAPASNAATATSSEEALTVSMNQTLSFCVVANVFQQLHLLFEANQQVFG